jgi:hypothetical protein
MLQYIPNLECRQWVALAEAKAGARLDAMIGHS